VIDVPLPSLGADMDEGTLLEWRVGVGDTVRRGQVVAVVDTTKSALDVESWQEGTVVALLAKPGETLPVGQPLLRLAIAGDSVDAPRAPAPAPASAAGAAGTNGAEAEGGPIRARVAPGARRRATELGIDTAGVAGTGPGGAVTLDDVERAAAAASPPRAGAPELRATPPVTAEARGAALRRTIAAAMSRAKREIPHYYLGELVAVGPALDWLAERNAARPVAARLLLAAVYLKAVALAARDHEGFNGAFVEGEFRRAPAVNVGVAVTLRGGGLLAPAVLEADTKPVDQLMAELKDLVARARGGTLSRRELAEATITVTNLGEASVAQVYGIVYAPQVALVGIGGVARRPWVVGDRVQPEPTAWLTLSADHRVTDGHAGARFLAAIAARLSDPARL
jgi:pyruvate dehydrogenase E2 component (dihydrolipoamide acetyltransferase)